LPFRDLRDRGAGTLWTLLVVLLLLFFAGVSAELVAAVTARHQAEQLADAAALAAASSVREGGPAACRSAAAAVRRAGHADVVRSCSLDGPDVAVTVILPMRWWGPRVTVVATSLAGPRRVDADPLG
jgi:secretion/DNA translocation related TadE-like protein